MATRTPITRHYWCWTRKRWEGRERPFFFGLKKEAGQDKGGGISSLISPASFGWVTDCSSAWLWPLTQASPSVSLWSTATMTAVLFVPARSGGPANPGGLQFFCLNSLVSFFFFFSHLYKSGGMCSPYGDFAEWSQGASLYWCLPQLKDRYDKENSEICSCDVFILFAQIDFWEAARWCSG